MRSASLDLRRDPLTRVAPRPSLRAASRRRNTYVQHRERVAAGGDLLESLRQASELAVRAERQRLARELHDSVAQMLYSITLSASRVLTLLERSETDTVHTVVSEMLRQANDSQRELRALVYELRSDESRRLEVGLVTSLVSLAAELEASGAYRVRLSAADEPDLSLKTKETLIRIAREALRNSAKHAHASQVDLVLETGASEVTLVVADDGRGFDTNAHHPGHFGLQLMYEEAIAVGGKLDLISTPGRGTQVRVRVQRGRR
jgi:signal transduction histidine kinase